MRAFLLDQLVKLLSLRGRNKQHRTRSLQQITADEQGFVHNQEHDRGVLHLNAVVVIASEPACWTSLSCLSVCIRRNKLQSTSGLGHMSLACSQE